MQRRFSRFTSIFRCITISLFLLACSVPASFAATCDNPYNFDLVIGLEFVAVQCVGEGMNDNSTIHYVVNMIGCDGAKVYLNGSFGDDYGTPGYIATSLKDSVNGYRVFRNKEGTHIMAVFGSYNGHVDGIYVNSYAPGQIYTDVFKNALILPATPNCDGGDHNDGCNERNSSSTVNLGTGRLSHDQRIFTLNSGLPLALDISLYYRSIPFAPSAIGDGWSHSYEMSLQNGAGTSKVFWYHGKRRIYNKYTTAYVSPKGDYSSLLQNADGTWTITEPDGLRRNFDVSGNITSLVDRYGNALTFNYTSGKLTTVTDPGNRTVTFGYDPTSGKLVTITDPNNKSYTLDYPNGKLETLTLPGGDQWGYTYNASNGLLETKTDPDLFSSSYVYTGQKVTAATDPNLKASGYSFAAPTAAGKIPDAYPIQVAILKYFTLADKDLNSWVFTYDGLIEKIRSKKDPLNYTTNYTYYPNGLRKSVTEPPMNGVSYTTFYTYDLLGNVTNETEPLDTSALGIDPDLVVDPATDSRINTKFAFSYTYDLTNTNPAFKNLITRMDDKRGPNILTTTYSYSTDAEGYLVTAVTDPAMATTVIRHYSNGKIKDITDANLKQTTYNYYDDTPQNQAAKVVGFLKSIVTPDGVTTSYYDPSNVNVAYDANGNNIWHVILDKDGVPRKTVISTYDDRNRLQTVTTRAPGQPDIITTYGYDANDNLNSVKDAEQKETKYLFDFNRQTTKITDARLKSTDLVYGGSGCPSCGNGADKLTSVTDANQHSTTYSYDKVGRLEYETDPLGKKYHYTYHPNGKLDKKYNATSGTDVLQVSYNHNNRGQLTGKQYADGSSVSYGYDENGRIQTASNANISYTFSNYTGGSYKGRLKSVKDNTNNRTVSYEQYNALGQRKQVTVSDVNGSRTTTHQYDDANRPWIITAGTKVFTYLYDKLGRRDTISYPNSVTAKHDYDNLDRLTGIKHSTATATITFANYSGFDKTGSRKSKITSNGAETYQYDEIYRLTQTDTPKGPEKYSYDDVGNRTGGPGPKESLPIITYAYDDANRMTHGRQLVYDYDDAGNQTARSIPNTPDKGWTLTWDLENRLTRMEKFRKVNNIIVESRTIDFKYDPFDRRIEKKVTTLINDVTKTTTWSYLYDGDNIAAEYFGTTATYYIHGPGVDEHLAMERGGVDYYYHADGLGSVTAITDSSSSPAIVQSYSYDSFGVPRQTTSFPNSFMYTGREWDKEAGLYYYRARYYDPMEGRFVSKDPIGSKGGDVNLYGYVHQNPINKIDPLGLKESCVWGGFSGSIAFGIGLQVVAECGRCVDDCGKVTYRRRNCLCFCYGLGASASGQAGRGDSSFDQSGWNVSTPYGSVSGSGTSVTGGGYGPGAGVFYCNCSCSYN
ncbi:MAG TPA: hypothetical protein DER40_09660 [Geobacter sp.]|nr:hypothetical protein [Geobacter sp.]